MRDNNLATWSHAQHDHRQPRLQRAVETEAATWSTRHQTVWNVEKPGANSSLAQWSEHDTVAPSSAVEYIDGYSQFGYQRPSIGLVVLVIMRGDLRGVSEAPRLFLLLLLVYIYGPLHTLLWILAQVVLCRIVVDFRRALHLCKTILDWVRVTCPS